MAVKIDGINIHYDAKHIGLIKPFDPEWVRIDINWWEVEVSENNFKWDKISAVVNAAKSAGKKIYASLMGSPKWHRPAFNNPPDVYRWTNFCSRCARQFGPKIDVYSLWNEPNLGKRFWTGSMKEFFQTIVAPGYEAIKSVNPGFFVAAPDLATLGSSDWPEWLSEMRHHTKYFDIVSIHAYHDTAEETIRCFTWGKVPVIGWIVPKWRPYNWYLDKLNKPVYLTEVGREAKYGDTKAMKKQKEYVQGIMDGRYDMGVERIFFYCLMDAPAGTEEPWGFYDVNGNPKTVAQ